MFPHLLFLFWKSYCLSFKELRVSECYFLWDNVFWNLLNSGPIGLSIMVVLLESYLQNLEKNTIELALRFDTAPKAFRRYVDDTHTRF